ncbi:predicted protein [Nematostella vectensis]|uniref:VOC domain-containing protein n=1 Tax=Nematostella vectensis TaxID=45351 RepID=A7RM33_NEMVE|nr:glyoxalase domain-containing protein 4 [Nematostella vectensis]EDO47433.1 predicted protein [Nematostella vectensis]|eukprot:XP_001639496.1 predicted protein [Nematostella vectensis]
MASKRALHFVFKVANRTETAKFYREILGMKVLRHEEFEKGCDAACNGPYDGKWSKTMIGYGPEDDHFVVELTYNYGIKEYKVGNDFQGLTLHSKDVVSRAKEHNYSMEQGTNGHYTVHSPGGYKFHLADEEASGDPVKKVSLGVSNLSKSLEYWNKLLGMQVFSQTDTTAILGYDAKQCKLELVQVGQVDHGTAFGRIAFSCPKDDLPGIESESRAAGHTILTPLISLDTPGKATVHVVILADPDGHEICFVGDEAFRKLSHVDPEGDRLLSEAIAADKSDEYFAKKKNRATKQ